MLRACCHTQIMSIVCPHCCQASSSCAKPYLSLVYCVACLVFCEGANFYIKSNDVPSRPCWCPEKCAPQPFSAWHPCSNPISLAGRVTQCASAYRGCSSSARRSVGRGEDLVVAVLNIEVIGDSEEDDISQAFANAAITELSDRLFTST